MLTRREREPAPVLDCACCCFLTYWWSNPDWDSQLPSFIVLGVDLHASSRAVKPGAVEHNCGRQAVHEGKDVQDHVRQGRGPAHLCAGEQPWQGRFGAGAGNTCGDTKDSEQMTERLGVGC
eukprot:1159459-Pelagomonas_calceolata.AAC.4